MKHARALSVMKHAHAKKLARGLHARALRIAEDTGMTALASRLA
jgi:hypothetical protein